MRNKRLQVLKFVLLLGFFAIMLFSAKTVNAATLYFSPSSGSFLVGDILSVDVLVNTQGESINNSDAVINFPSGLLEIISISKSNSIFSLWVEEPAFSNSAGAISFNGGLPTPGFDGVAGKIVNIVFRARNAGAASLIFSSGAVRANDGYGTDVLETSTSAKFNLISVEVPVAAPSAGVPDSPTISSPTHTNSAKWYSSNDTKFTWDVPSGITGTKLLVGRLPVATPNVFYAEPISEKQLTDFIDGVWYFHVQLRNWLGWGVISHFKFLIDTEPPKPFEIIVEEGEETVQFQPMLAFEAVDEMSGIDYYEVGIDLLEPIKTKETVYRMPVQNVGKHTVIVRAVDMAGNNTLAMTEINILSIESPVITDYPCETLDSGSVFSVRGTALPEATVELYIQHDDGEVRTGETKSNVYGSWAYTDDEPMKKGVYQVWAEAIDASGARSEPSGKITISVSSTVLTKTWSLTFGYLAVVIALVILIFIIMFEMFCVKRKARRKSRPQSFKVLKKEAEEYVAKLGSRPNLSKRERQAYNNLKKALKSSEKFMKK